MNYKHFRFIAILRVLFLCSSVYLFFFLLLRTGLYATIFIVCALILYQIYALIRFVEKTNQQLSRFLEAIRYSDFSQSFSSKGLGYSFDDLNKAFSSVISDFKKARAEKEENYRYLQTVVQHVGIGLIGFTEDGEVELINGAAKRLLKIKQIKNIDALSRLSESLVSTLFKLKAGKSDLVQVQEQDELLQLAIYATEFRLQDRAVKLVTIQNIQSELEEKEFDAWQKLIRVLTHEIMNSITPISSLASTANEILTDCENDNFKNLDAEAIADIRSATRTIQRRSEGLLHFVESYRKLTRLPKPKFKISQLIDLFENIRQLMTTQFKENRIKFVFQIKPEDLEFTADPDLIEQVLLNLIKNSIQALKNRVNAEISMTAKLDDRNRVIIQVSDNGPGISKEVKDNIFIPFYTTKKEGSGIGLSLSRQIMRLHKGTISVLSQPDKKTVFTLRF